MVMLKCLLTTLCCLLLILSAVEKDWEQIGSEVKKLHSDARKQEICGPRSNWKPTPRKPLRRKCPPLVPRTQHPGRIALFAFPENIRNH